MLSLGNLSAGFKSYRSLRRQSLYTVTMNVLIGKIIAVFVFLFGALIASCLPVYCVRKNKSQPDGASCYRTIMEIANSLAGKTHTENLISSTGSLHTIPISGFSTTDMDHICDITLAEP